MGINAHPISKSFVFNVRKVTQLILTESAAFHPFLLDMPQHMAYKLQNVCCRVQTNGRTSYPKTQSCVPVQNLAPLEQTHIPHIQFNKTNILQSGEGLNRLLYLTPELHTFYQIQQTIMPIIYIQTRHRQHLDVQ